MELRVLVVALSFGVLASLFISAEALNTFVHVTDVHWDPYYTAGASVSNDCHIHKSFETQSGAGPFGDRNCDSPTSIVASAFKFMSRLTPTPDFVVWTGDSARHDHDPSLPTSMNEVLGEIGQVTQWMAQAFPNIPVVPSIGNNDVYPHDSIDQGPNEILDNLTATWARWLTKKSITTMLSGGYFATEVIDGLQVISLNTLYWAKMDDAVDACKDSKSPGALQFAWLNEMLSLFRAQKQKIYLTGHVPPHKFYHASCQSMYENMAANYSDIIVAHLFGHRHSDDFFILSNNAAAINVAPSVLPQFNPAVRVFIYDPDTKNILNYIQYYASLDLANSQGVVQWVKEYDPLSAYGLHSPLTPAQWIALKQDIENGVEPFASLYQKYQSVSSTNATTTI
jgi:hypothetical protein